MITRLSRFVLPLAAAAALAPAAVHAQTQAVTFTATADTYVHAGYPTEAFGTQDLLFVLLGTPPNRSRALIDFNLAPLAGGEIQSATLHLQMYQSGSASVPAWLSRITEPWTEAGATWNNQPATTSTLPQSQITKSTATLSFDVTSLIAEAAADPANFHGIQLLSRETGAAYTYAFNSRERQAGPPMLDVTYVPAVDVTGPVISGATVTEIAITSAVAAFATDEDATATVEFGLDTSYGRSITETAATKNHRVTLFPLASNSSYHYRIRARDAAGNETVTADAAFTTPESSGALPAGSLIKLPDDGNPVTLTDTAVYYVGSDGQRHPFPSARLYASWYVGFSGVQVVTPSQMAQLPLGANVRYRPGVRLVKFTTVSTVYAVSRGGVLRPIMSEAVAAAIFGPGWPLQIDDLSDVLFGNYTFGADVTSVADYDPAAERAATVTIDQDFGRA